MGRPRKQLGEIVDTVDLSRILGLTENRCRQLRKNGVFPEVLNSTGSAVEGRWNLAVCVQSYIAYKTKDKQSTKASVDLDSAKLRKLNAQAEQEELRTDLMKGRVIRCVDAERTWGDFVSACRSKLLSMPTKLARVLMGQKDLVYIATTIEDEVHQALNELKEFDIDDIQKFNPEFVLSEIDREGDKEDDFDDSQDDSTNSEDS